MTRRSLFGGLALAQAPAPKTYLVKLSTPVDVRKSRADDRVRAALISPESYLNGYLEGTIAKVSARPHAALLMRFDKLVYKGREAAVRTELIDWVNSKGHKGVDDAERPLTLVTGELRSAGRALWLDEGAELRLRVDP